DVGEGAVAVVVKEDVAAAGAGDVEIGIAVVVVISEGGADADAVAERDAGLVGDIDERAVSLVLVELVGTELIEQIDVFVTVVVEIADRETAAVIIEVDLELLSLLVRKEVHVESEAGVACHFTKAGMFLTNSLGALALICLRIQVAQHNGQDRARDSAQQSDSQCQLAGIRAEHSPFLLPPALPGP